jgi:hypothetical protein
VPRPSRALCERAGLLADIGPTNHHGIALFTEIQSRDEQARPSLRKGRGRLGHPPRLNLPAAVTDGRRKASALLAAGPPLRALQRWELAQTASRTSARDRRPHRSHLHKKA